MANNIEVYRGDDKSISLTFTDKATGLAEDITGWTVYFTVKEAYDNDPTDSAALITKDVTSHTAPTSGQTAIALTDTNTNISPGSYFYDIQAKDASGNIMTVVSGIFEVLADVTRRTT